MPVHIEGGQDGIFGPGDSLVFVGEMLRGEYSYLDEYSSFNCYFLDFKDSSPRQFTTSVTQDRATVKSPAAAFESRYHLEQDRLILRFRQAPGNPQEIWYWQRLAHLDRLSFRQLLDLNDLKRTRGGMVNLTINFKGWSRPHRKPDPDIFDHHVDIMFNGTIISSGEWNGQESHTVSMTIPIDQFAYSNNYVLLRTPKRKSPSTGETLIDVAMLNWIEVSYPRATRVVDDQTIVYAGGGDNHGPGILQSKPGTTITAFTTSGTRIVGTPSTPHRIVLDPAQHGDRFFVTTTSELPNPQEVLIDRPSNLRTADQQSDYIIVAHHSLIEAIEPLVDCHRRRGLSVTVVDVQDVYDEFNHGVIHPRSIRDFLKHAFHSWQQPAPRYVLLVGDASWDYKNPTTDDSSYADWTYQPRDISRFQKNKSTPYSENVDLNHRNLVPTWNYSTLEGHAASDNWLACVDGEDDYPEMALGRFAAATPAEVAGMVAKTVAYIENSEVGPWRRNVVFISNESAHYQKGSHQIANDLVTKGYAPSKIFPQSTEESNEHHTQRIIDSLDEGAQFIHFIGHGGRYIWRTGPRDLKKNHDLFTLDHLDTLRPNGRLPVVLSLTCYSAPFDHPTADSIGEKLLRLPKSGAIAVLAASWRNSPSIKMGEKMLYELMQPGTTIGEAIVRGKKGLRGTLLIQTYNLLGDPAAPVATPQFIVDLKKISSENPLSVHGSIDLYDFNGKALIEWIDTDLEVIQHSVLDLERSEFTADLDLESLNSEHQLLGVRVYIWNETIGYDAVGWLEY
ncbi:MAG: hypothetical protein GY906_07410 [bacterium]|nr:hypothetical protein [bacterium]